MSGKWQGKGDEKPRERDGKPKKAAVSSDMKSCTTLPYTNGKWVTSKTLSR